MTVRQIAGAAALACLILVAGMSAPAAAQQGAPNGEWPYYGGDLGGTKYSGLDQIDASNFNDLEIAWRWRSADGGLDLDALRAIHPDLSLLNLKATPLMIGGVVYIVTPLRLAVALDAGTGATLWVHNPEVVGETRYSINANNFSSRGGAYWRDGNEERFYYGTPDGYLLALDARTGEPVRSFGDNGRVDLAAELPRNGRGIMDNKGHPFRQRELVAARGARRRRHAAVNLRSADHAGAGAGLGAGDRRADR